METKTANNVILNDGGMEKAIWMCTKEAKEKGMSCLYLVNLITRIWKGEEDYQGENYQVIVGLIERTKNAGIYRSNFIQAVTKIWKDEYVRENYECTDSEKIFEEKAERFFEYYKADLILLYNSQQKNESNWVKDEDAFIKQYYQIVCAMYALFEREGIVLQKTINQLFNQRFGLLISQCDIKQISFLRTFLCRLDFVEKKVPTMNRVVGQQIYYQDDFKDLRQKYNSSTNVVFETALALIWLIQKYF